MSNITMRLSPREKRFVHTIQVMEQEIKDLREELFNVTADLETAEANQQWRPIETAPFSLREERSGLDGQEEARTGAQPFGDC